MKRISIITRSYPPNKGINGLLSNEMAGYLIDKNVEVDIICISGDSDGNKEAEIPNGKVHIITALNNKSNKIKKMISLLFEGVKLVRKAKSLNSDLIIVTSSPPLLPLWASLFLKKREWAFWAFDLFPEGLAIANLVKENGLLYKILYKYTYKTPPNLLIALGQNQAEHIQKKYEINIPTLILPAGVLLASKAIEEGKEPNWKRSEKITLGYFGNIGIAHNPEYLKLVMDYVHKSTKYQFLMSIYGVYADDLKNYAKGKKNVIIQEGGLPEEDLKHIDIHMVSLLTSWTHIAVPSKAVTAISCGRPILFCGSEESDNWQMFKKSGWLLKENEDIKEQLTQLLDNLTLKNVTEKANLTSTIYKSLKTQVIQTYDALTNFE